MELMLKHSLLCLLALVLVSRARAGCKEELANNKTFMDCAVNFGKFFTDMSSSGTDITDPKNMFDIICSEEGQSAFGCMLTHMRTCRELFDDGTGNNPMASLEKIDGFNMTEFMKKGGMEGVCAMMTGPCSEVTNCYSVPQSGMVKRQASPSLNYYMMFHTQSDQMCGAMKGQMTCVLNALEKCPSSVVDKVEREFEKAIQMSMPGAYGVVSFKDTKDFIQNECAKMPTDFAQDMCTKNVLVSPNFTDCNENVTMKYSKKRTCDVHNMSKKCIMDNVESKCGNETAMFFIRNTHIIFPGIPDNCESLTDVSGSDVLRLSFGMLLMSTLYLLCV